MKLPVRSRSWIIGATLFIVWLAAHIPAIGLFAHVPFVSAVVGDEPSPLYGALSVLEAKSPLGLRNVPQLYYGPVFAVVAIPAVVADVGIQYVKGVVHDPESYRALITRDMGGMLIASRWLAVFAGFFALFGIYRLFQSKQLNPDGKTWWMWLAVVGIALDPFFFKYSHFYRHWVFIIAILIWNLVFVFRIADKPDDKKAWFGLWATSAFGFGISFISLFYQAALFPLLWRWTREKHVIAWKYFLAYGVSLAAAIALLVAWDPFPYFRLIRMGTQSGTGHTLRIGLPSLLSYATYLWNNYVLIGALAIGLSVLAWAVARDRVRSWWWIAVWPGIAHLVFFAASETNPPRYLLPIYVLLWVVAVGSADALWPWLTFRRLAKPLIVLFILTFMISGAQSARWSWLASQPQPEEKLIAGLQQLSATSTVIYEGHLLPAWHDAKSYEAYAKHCLDYDSDVFAYMATLLPLPGIKPISVTYSCGGYLSQEWLRYYDYLIIPNGESLESNVLEANWWRHWDMDRWGLHFRESAGNLSL